MTDHEVEPIDWEGVEDSIGRIGNVDAMDTLENIGEHLAFVLTHLMRAVQRIEPAAPSSTADEGRCPSLHRSAESSPLERAIRAPLEAENARLRGYLEREVGLRVDAIRILEDRAPDEVQG
jgi:hypothetical protein